MSGRGWNARLICQAVVIGIASFAYTGVNAMTVLSDGTFDPLDWNSALAVMTGNGGAVVAVQEPALGNPGANYLVTHTVNGRVEVGQPSTMSASHLRMNFIYDPTISGAINSLDISLDDNHIGIGGQFYSFIVQQDGMLFSTMDALTSIGWTTTSMVGLSAGDFAKVLPDGSRDAASNPDFSQSGAAIIFGFLTSNSNLSLAGIVRQAAYDNFEVSLMTAAIPIPTAVWLFGPAVFTLLVSIRHRQI